MASEIDICNLALSHIGDSATVSSINPPEGSAQAEHCAIFYPIARNALLERHNWKFATRRTDLALLSETMDQWTYVYAMPNSANRIIDIIPPTVTNDYSVGYTNEDLSITDAYAVYVPQRYSIETLSTGTQVICCNTENAVARYTVKITDPTVFSSLFTLTLSHYLASMLAGPVVKGDAGAAEAKRQLTLMQMYLSQAAISDAEQSNIRPTQAVPWLAGR